MANNDSPIVTNLEATPAVVSDVGELYGRVRVAQETFEIAAADNDGDTYTFFPVPLDARILDVRVVNDAITGGTDYDAGFYKITDNNLGAAIDADILFDGQTMASARASYTSLMFAGTSAADQGELSDAVWEMCGYASIDAARDANQTNMVYLVVTANTVGTAAGTLSLQVLMSVD